jgi:hypothetical protein
VSVLNLSCADKTANIQEMCHWLDWGHQTEEFTSRDHASQLAKLDALDQVYQGKVAYRLYRRFADWLETFRQLAPGSREQERASMVDYLAFRERTHQLGQALVNNLNRNVLRDNPDDRRSPYNH